MVYIEDGHQRKLRIREAINYVAVVAKRGVFLFLADAKTFGIHKWLHLKAKHYLL